MEVEEVVVEAERGRGCRWAVHSDTAAVANRRPGDRVDFAGTGIPGDLPVLSQSVLKKMQKKP